MAGNFDCIGLGVDNEDQLHDLVVRLASAAGERLSTDAGEYAIWRSRTGAELWFHLGPAPEDEDGEREILGVTPFFEGRSDVLLNIDEAIKRPDDNALEGAFHGWLDENTIIFDAVDFAAHSGRPLPAHRQVRLAGFAREINVPAGDGEGAVGRSLHSHPTASAAQLTGQIADFAELINEATGQRFYWLQVEGPLGAYDIVAAPHVVNGELAAGATVNVACAFFGRILD